MQLTLEIQSGTLVGHKKWLSPGEKLLVGRTELAGFVVAADRRMSNVHFIVECEPNECRIRDMRSTNGTFLNGKKVGEAVLSSGDEVMAGETKFVVQIRGNLPEPPQASGGTTKTKTLDDVSTPSASPVSPAAGGNANAWLRFGVPSLRHPVDIVEQVATIAPLYLIVDFSKIAMPIPEQLVNPQYLYDWHPPKLLPHFSPVVMAGSSLPDCDDLIRKAWGHDCVVALFSPLAEDQLVERLRLLTKSTDEAHLHREYACPDALAKILAGDKNGFSTSLFEAVEAILFEIDGGEDCGLFAPCEISSKLNELGLEVVS